MKDIQAIIFDLDNTILDRTRSFKSFAASMLDFYFPDQENNIERLELVMDWDQDGYKDKRELFQELLDRLPWQEKPQHEELMAYYKLHYANHASLVENALSVIRYIRTKYKTGLITNGRNEIQYAKIERMALRVELDYIIVSEEAGYKKPDRRIFEAACEGLNLRPEQCIYVGDHPVIDIEGAWLAGLSVIWVKVNQPWRAELQAQPLYTIDRFDELLNIL